VSTFDDERMLELLRRLEGMLKTGDNKSAMSFLTLIITALEPEEK